MANVFDQFDSSDSGNVFDQFDQAPVKPGDVEAAKKRYGVEGDTVKGFTNKLEENRVRPDTGGSLNPLVSIPTEAMQGGAEALGGFADTVMHPLDAIKNLFSTGALESAPARAALGATRVVAAPLAPVSNLIGRGSEALSNLLERAGVPESVNNVVSGTGQAVADVLAPIGIAKAAAAIKPLVTTADILQSQKAKALAAGKAGDAAISDIEDRAANLVREAESTGESARAAARTKAAQQIEDLANARANAQVANESVKAIGEAAKRNIFNKSDLEAAAGGKTGEEAGVAYKVHYDETRAARKADANALYDEALGPREAGQTAATDKIDTIEQRGKDLIEQQRAARGTPREEAANKALSDFYENPTAGDSNNLHDLHDDLITIRFQKRQAALAQNDNQARLLGAREDKILGKMEKLSPGVTDSLAEADANYAENYAPYFSKNSLTRAIADKDASVIAKNAILPRSTSGKEVATIQRTMELIGNNKSLQADIAQAHFKGLIDDASKAVSTPDGFRKALVKGWERYTNPSGNNNKVLRTAYGDNYDKFNSIINQVKGATERSFDDWMAQSIKSNNAAVAKLPSEAAIEAGKGMTLREAAQAQRQSIKFANDSRKLDLSYAKKRNEEAIQQFFGGRVKYENGKLIGNHDYGAGRFIGQLYLTEGALQAASGNAQGAVTKVLTGGGLLLTRAALNKLLVSERGVGLLKAALRNAPGTAQAAANARIVQNFVSKDQNE